MILSDGNENRGNALEQALAAKSLGVQIDVLPIDYRYDREVLVEKVSIPPDVKKGETVNINVVIRASEPTTRHAPDLPEGRQLPRPAAGNEKPAAGRAPARDQRLHAQAADHRAELLHVHRRVHPRQGQRRPPGDQQRGRGVHPRPGQGPGPPDRGDARASTPSWSRPCARRRSRSRSWLAPRIDGSGGVGGDPLPTDLAQLQPYDAVILANVPKDAFTEAQHQLLDVERATTWGPA